MVFVCAMIVTGMTAVAIATFEGKPSNAGGAVTVYFVLTAYTAVKPLSLRLVDVVLMVLAFTFAAGSYGNAFTALDNPGNQIDGVPAAMLFFLATVILLAAIGDARVILAGGIQGTRRLARHLWRMCFGLFIASGTFVAQLAPMKFLPAPIRSVPVIVALAAGPLVVLLYWMWRVRLRQNLRGLMTTKPIEAP